MIAAKVRLRTDRGKVLKLESRTRVKPKGTSSAQMF